MRIFHHSKASHPNHLFVGQRGFFRLGLGEPEREVEVVIKPGLVASADPTLMRVILLNLWDKPVFLVLVQKLYREGFRLISWRPNIGAGVREKRYLGMEVVFKRNNLRICPGYDV